MKDVKSRGLASRKKQFCPAYIHLDRHLSTHFLRPPRSGVLFHGPSLVSHASPRVFRRRAVHASADRGNSGPSSIIKGGEACIHGWAGVKCDQTPTKRRGIQPQVYRWMCLLWTCLTKRIVLFFYSRKTGQGPNINK